MNTTANTDHRTGRFGAPWLRGLLCGVPLAVAVAVAVHALGLLPSESVGTHVSHAVFYAFLFTLCLTEGFRRSDRKAAARAAGDDTGPDRR